MWILAIVVLGLAYAVIPGFGRVLKYLSGAALVLGVCLVWWRWEAIVQWDENRRWLRTLIAPAEVSVKEGQLTRDGRGYRFGARVRNGSPKYAISDLFVTVTFRNCDSLGHCQVIYANGTYIAHSIPPGQARDVVGWVAMKGPARARNQLQWDAKVTEVTASLPKE